MDQVHMSATVKILLESLSWPGTRIVSDTRCEKTVTLPCLAVFTVHLLLQGSFKCQEEKINSS